MKKLTILLAAFVISFSIADAQNQQVWKPNPKFVSKAQKKEKSETHQCFGTTKKGERCKIKISKDSKYCYKHKNQE